MHVLGITGGIGSGKSVVAQCLHLMGIPVYNCDNEAKRLNNSHPSIRKGLIQLIGEDIYTLEGVLNKEKLTNYLFDSPLHAAKVNAIIHPCVKDDFIQWKERQHTPWVAIESAILYESGFAPLADKVVTVYAPEEIRIRRAVRRDQSSPKAIRQRIAQQISDDEKRKMADYTIYNDDIQPILPQILDILANLLCLSQK